MAKLTSFSPQSSAQNKKSVGFEAKMETPFSTSADFFLTIYAVKALNTGKVIALSANRLPFVQAVCNLAKKQRSHLGVYAGDLKLFDTRFYLPELKEAV